MSRKHVFDWFAFRQRRPYFSKSGAVLNPSCRRLRVERLEVRQMLAVTVTVSGTSVSFDGDSANDSLYLTTMTSGGNHVLAYNTDGSTNYTPIDSLVTSNGLNITTDLDIAETFLRDFIVPGADLLVTSASGITVEAGQTISTRMIASGTADIAGHATDTSTGSSGSVTLAAPMIDALSDAKLLTHVEVGSSFTAGSIAVGDDLTSTITVPGAGITGSLTATAQDDIFITETSGDLHVSRVQSLTGKVSLVSTAGGIHPAANTTDANVIATSVDLNAPAGDIGGDPLLEIDRLFVQLVLNDDDDPTMLSAESGGNIYMDIQGLLRDDTVAPGDFVVNVNRIDAEGFVDLQLLEGLSGQNADTTVETTYDFGLIEAGGDIDVKSDFEAIAPPIHVDANTNTVSGGATPGLGHIEVQTNGNIRLTETEGDLRSGLVVSTAGDVALTSSTGSIIDAPSSGDDTSGDAAADTIGTNVTLTAPQGGIGTATNPLDIDSSNPTTGALTATAQNDIFITETLGDLNVNQVRSQAGDVSLTAANGSIFDANNNATENVVGTSISLSTSPTSGIGIRVDPLEVDSSNAASGALTATAQNDIFITETTGDLNLNLVQSAEGDVRLVSTTGSILDSNNDPSANIEASSIDTAASGSIGVSDNHLDIDSSNSMTGRLIALANNDIYITEVAGELNVLSINSGTEAALTASDDDSDGQDMNLLQTGNDLSLNRQALTGIISAQEAVTLTAGDDVTIPAGTFVVSQGAITINVDTATNDPDEDGGDVLIRGSLGSLAGTVINGGDGNDVIDIIPNFAPLTVNGDDPTLPAAPGDTLRVDLSGDQLTNTQAPGNGTFDFQTFLDITYNDIETLESTNSNDPPVNVVSPGPHTTATNMASTFLGNGQLGVVDSDADTATDFKVTLDASNGTLSVDSSLVPSLNVNGNGTNTVALTGNKNDMNAVFAGGVTYTPDTGFAGIDTMTITSDDQGNAGTGGPLTDTDSINIIVGDTDAPNVKLADPVNGGSISRTALNSRGYIDVTFTDIGSELDSATIDGDELRISGTGLGTSVLGGTAALQSGTTYRYPFTGDFVPGDVMTEFVAGSFSDLAGNRAAGASETFTVDIVEDTTLPTAALSDPVSGGTVPRDALNNRQYIDVTFADIGSGIDPATVDGDELQISGSGVGTAVLEGNAVLQSGTTYRYPFTGDFVTGGVTVEFVAGSFGDLVGNVNESATDNFTVTDDLVGDYNRDGRVNAADYVVYRNTEGDQVTPFSGADGNGNGIVDDGDYDVWKRNYSRVAGTGSVNPLDPGATGDALAEINSAAAVRSDTPSPSTDTNERSPTHGTGRSRVPAVAFRMTDRLTRLSTATAFADFEESTTSARVMAPLDEETLLAVLVDRIHANSDRTDEASTPRTERESIRTDHDDDFGLLGGYDAVSQTREDLLL